ncbi:MAG: VOC family protein [Paracoccaceae bacterium]|nr:VOC family protein [Paracoccaceae bacterium]
MHLGAFSISLAVKDLDASKSFYETLGFTTMGGDAGQGWLILTSGDTIVGLFSGMFEKNLLTFNPGWDQKAQPLGAFTDVRDIHGAVKAAGLATEQETGLDGEGPASFVVVDPDGNPVLIDQHVPKPS